MKLKKSLFANDIIVCVKHLLQSTKKKKEIKEKIELISEYSKTAKKKDQYTKLYSYISAMYNQK